MVTYIKSDVRNIYIELENELAPELYPNLGTTWQDYLDNLFVKLSDEQVAFKNEHPKAKVHEVWNMEMDPVHVRNVDDAKIEKKDELERYKNEHIGEFKYNGKQVWFSETERIVKQNEAQIAKNNGEAEYALASDLKVPVNTAISLFDSMTNREYEFNKVVSAKQAEIDSKENMEDVDGIDVSTDFPTEVEINEEALVEQDKTASKNNENLMLIEVMKLQINNLDLSDEQAYNVRLLYPEWETLVGQLLKVETKVQYNGKLFKVITEHTAQLDWAPGEDTASLFTEINETHAGTYEDPIPYSGNMVLEYGKYYSQDGITYKCIRNSEIAVFDTLAKLATVEGGSYVEVATE